MAQPAQVCQQQFIALATSAALYRERNLSEHAGVQSLEHRLCAVRLANEPREPGGGRRAAFGKASSALRNGARV